MSQLSIISTHSSPLLVSDTQTHRHTDAQTHRRTDAQTHRRTDAETQRRTDAETQRRRDAETHRRTDAQTHRRTDAQTHRRTDAQTHRHTDTQTHRHTHCIYCLSPQKQVTRFVIAECIIFVTRINTYFQNKFSLSVTVAACQRLYTRHQYILHGRILWPKFLER